MCQLLTIFMFAVDWQSPIVFACTQALSFSLSGQDYRLAVCPICVANNSTAQGNSELNIQIRQGPCKGCQSKKVWPNFFPYVFFLASHFLGFSREICNHMVRTISTPIVA